MHFIMPEDIQREVDGVQDEIDYQPPKIPLILKKRCPNDDISHGEPKKTPGRIEEIIDTILAWYFFLAFIYWAINNFFLMENK